MHRGFRTVTAQTRALQLLHRSRCFIVRQQQQQQSGSEGSSGLSVSRDRECGTDQRLLDYGWLSWNESFWTGRLKDHLESMGDYRSERAEGPGGKQCAAQPLGGCRYLPAKTLLKSLRQPALININRKSTLAPVPPSFSPSLSLALYVRLFFRSSLSLSASTFLLFCSCFCLCC